MTGFDKTIIRPVRREDLAQIIKIDETLVGENRAHYLEMKLDDVLDEKWRLVASNVIEIENLVVGFVFAEVYTGEFGLPEKIARLDTIGILPQFSGKGLASELFNHTMDQLKKLGVSQIQTLVDWKDQGLIQFFASKGFEPGQLLSLGMKL